MATSSPYSPMRRDQIAALARSRTARIAAEHIGKPCLYLSHLERRCSDCKTWKPAVAFPRSAGRPLGLHSACKACHNKRTAQHKEQNRESELIRKREWARQARRDPEKRQAKLWADRDYYHANREKLTRAQRIKRAQNREHFNSLCAQYNARHRAYLSEITRLKRGLSKFFPWALSAMPGGFRVVWCEADNRPYFNPWQVRQAGYICPVGCVVFADVSRDECGWFVAGSPLARSKPELEWILAWLMRQCGIATQRVAAPAPEEVSHAK